MANYDLIFDLGANYITAALKKDGFVDKIPSVVAYGGQDSKEIVAVGLDAFEEYNRQHGAVKLGRPILEGAVIDVEGVTALVKELLTRLIGGKLTAFNRYNVYCISPCVMSSTDKKTVECIFLGLGARQVFFVENPVAISYQLFGEFSTRQGIVADLGCDCADIAIVYSNAIVSGCTLYYAGRQLTEAIIERIASKYMVHLSFEQAEYLKVNCVSMFPNDATAVVVSGQNVRHGGTENISVSAKELYDTVVDFAKKYVTVIQGLVAGVPQKLQSLVKRTGVMLCGGTAKIAGLDAYLQRELGFPVKISARCDDAAVEGMLSA